MDRAIAKEIVETTYHLSLIKIVVAESDPMRRCGLESILSSYSHLDVLTAADELTTIRSVERFKPNLIILDLSLNPFSSTVFIKKIKQNYPNVKILAYTNSTKKEDIFEAITNGVDGYFVKDNDVDGLLTAIATVMNDGFYLDSQIKSIVTNNLHFSNLANNFNELSQREWEILKYIVQGNNNFEIGKLANLSQNTVKNYVSSITSKIGVKNRIQAAVLATRCGFF
jgi:DNA-binding NarL/FixJ family response regulator